MKNIIFDLGNVLLSFHPDEFLDQYYTKDIKDDLMTIIFASDEWVDLDLGLTTITQVIHDLSQRYPQYKDEISFVLTHWTSMLKPIEENVELVYKLHDMGYPLYILSNFHKEAIQTMVQKYDFFKLFQGGIISAYEKCAKPEDHIYHLLLERYQLNPNESLFIDDSLGNVHTANLIGIHTIHLAYQVSLKKELKEWKIIP